MDELSAQIRNCMYQYSRAIYRSIKDLIDPYADPEAQLEYRRAVLEACEETMERLASDPHYFANPDKSLFQDIRRYFPITQQAQVAWAVQEGVGAAVAFVQTQIEAGAFDGGVARCRATTRKGKPCQRTPLPGARLLPVAPASRALQSRGLDFHSCRPAALTDKLGSGLSHDTDKLIRQLSLVAFLMAERRALTARDVKGNVEGYSEMSDEAFARRFYSDRAELRDLGVPLQSQRDEFTGEELYTLRSERYFLPPLDLTDDELAALQTCFYLLEGKFAYAEPLRLALQNLALGRPGLADEAPSATAVRVEMRDPDYSAEMPGRLAKLETAISKQRTVKFGYRAMTSGKETERTLNPYGLLHDRGVWYVVGADLDRDAIRTFRVSRIRGDIRFATRRERDFRAPAEFDIDAFRGRAVVAVRRDRRRGADRGAPRDRRGGSSAPSPTAAASRTASSSPSTRACRCSPPGCCARTAAPTRSSPPTSAARSPTACGACATLHEGEPPKPARESRRARAGGAAERSSGPVTPERFGLLQALLAYLLAACGEDKDAIIPAAELVERFQIPHEELEDHLSLLNLVNFGGGCYAVYAELHDDEVHVDKELWGDTFRSAPRLTPLEARAIRLALEFVGPLIAAEAHRPLDRVRKKLEDTFGEFELSQTPEPHAAAGRGGPRRDADRRDPPPPARRDRVPEGGGGHADRAPGRAVLDRAARSRTGTSTRGTGRATTSAASGSTGCAARRLTDEEFEPREGFEPGQLDERARRADALLARRRPLGGRARRPRC